MYEDYLDWIATQVDLAEFGMISITFVDDEEMALLNKQYRQQEGPTDILTFTVPGCPGMPVMGDLYLCQSRFEDQFDLGDEKKLVLFLLSHGILHLLGWTHETQEKYNSMVQRQHELVNGWVSC